MLEWVCIAYGLNVVYRIKVLDATRVDPLIAEGEIKIGSLLKGFT